MTRRSLGCRILVDLPTRVLILINVGVSVGSYQQLRGIFRRRIPSFAHLLLLLRPLTQAKRSIGFLVHLRCHNRGKTTAFLVVGSSLSKMEFALLSSVPCTSLLDLGGDRSSCEKSTSCRDSSSVRVGGSADGHWVTDWVVTKTFAGRIPSPLGHSAQYARKTTSSPSGTFRTMAVVHQLLLALLVVTLLHSSLASTPPPLVVFCPLTPSAEPSVVTSTLHEMQSNLEGVEYNHAVFSVEYDQGTFFFY